MRAGASREEREVRNESRPRRPVIPAFPRPVIPAKAGIQRVAVKPAT